MNHIISFFWLVRTRLLSDIPLRPMELNALPLALITVRRVAHGSQYSAVLHPYNGHQEWAMPLRGYSALRIASPLDSCPLPMPVTAILFVAKPLNDTTMTYFSGRAHSIVSPHRCGAKHCSAIPLCCIATFYIAIGLRSFPGPWQDNVKLDRAIT